jgi:Family of unknown function (DUF6084)/Family of unknown function (DUF5947)
MSGPAGLRRFVSDRPAGPPAGAPAGGDVPPGQHGPGVGTEGGRAGATPQAEDSAAEGSVAAGASAAAEEKCEFCATVIPAEHGHVADLEQSSLMCACRPCYLLFMHGQAARGRYRSVPDRYAVDPDRPMTAAEWDMLDIPVGLAFFLCSSAAGEVTGFYPSPAGATQCRLDLAAWDRLAADHPLLEALAPDVEAALICRTDNSVEHFLVPALSLVLRISETSGQKVEAIALRCQIRIEPARRRYSSVEAERLNDLFGETERWADTLKPMQFTTVATMVPGFSGSCEIELPVPFTYDLEVGSARYFDSLEAGEIPLLLLFSGTVFTVSDGRMQVYQVPWSKEAAYRLPVSVWREAIDAHFPNSAWIKMSRQTMEELQRFKSSRALPTWDMTLTELLAQADADTTDQP